MTVVYVFGLLSPADLERLVLAPLASPLSDLPPKALARSGRFPAAELEVLQDAGQLAERLLAGMAAIHVGGHAGVVLVGSGQALPAGETFGPDLKGNVALLRRALRDPELRLSQEAVGHGGQSVVAYLRGRAPVKTVRLTRAWARTLCPHPPDLPWWQALLGTVRLPPAVETPTPAAVADALRRGYVAVLTDHMPGALLAPTTLELLFSGAQDTRLTPVLRRLVAWPRLAAALFGLTLGGLFVAVISYHHTLLPGPFLIALASGRQNLPFPFVIELLLVQLVGEGMRAGALRLGGWRYSLLGTIGTGVALTLALQAGIVAPLPAVIGIAEQVLLHGAPNPALNRAVRRWRFAFTGAAAGLGLLGMTLLGYVLMVYLGEERHLGHPLRLPPGVSP